MKMNGSVLHGCMVFIIAFVFLTAGCEIVQHSTATDAVAQSAPRVSELGDVEVSLLNVSMWGNLTQLNGHFGITAMHVYSSSGVGGDESESGMIPVAWGSSDEDSVSSNDWVVLQTVPIDKESSIPDSARRFILGYHFTEGERIWNVGYQVSKTEKGLHFKRIVTPGRISTSSFLQKAVSAGEYMVKWDDQFDMAGLSGSPILIWDQHQQEWIIVGMYLATLHHLLTERGLIGALPKEIEVYLESS